MEFWLVCLGILAYSCQNTSRDSGVWTVTNKIQKNNQNRNSDPFLTVSLFCYNLSAFILSLVFSAVNCFVCPQSYFALSYSNLLSPGQVLLSHDHTKSHRRIWWFLYSTPMAIYFFNISLYPRIRLFFYLQADIANTSTSKTGDRSLYITSYPVISQ